MPSEKTKILGFNQYQISNKAPFIVDAGLEWLREKIDGSKSYPHNSFTTKVGKNIPSGFSMSTKPSLRSIENNWCIQK